MRWWELVLDLGGAYRGFLRAHGGYLRRLEAGGDVVVYRVEALATVRAVSCERAPLLPLLDRAAHYCLSPQISLRQRAYPAAAPCRATWMKLYGRPPAPPPR